MLLRALALFLLGLALICAGLLTALYGGRLGEHIGPGEVTKARLPAESIAERAARTARASRRLRGAPEGNSRQILFGDLHVHTHISADAFRGALPIGGGEGVHPPADACDFARFCSGLDFWAITDHAEQISPRHWRETIDSIRECNAVSGDQTNPDVVAFLGWEWTQIGLTPEDHWGHKNVILRDIEPGKTPSRPISAGGLARQGRSVRPPLLARVLPPLLDFANRQTYFDLDHYLEQLRGLPECAEGVDVRELGVDCIEVAETPPVLFEKLAQWALPAIVIPHGTSWGLYTPAGKDMRRDLRPGVHDPSRQTLIEIFSGHGNAEEYRGWRHVAETDDVLSCPEPTGNFKPCCWRAGELIAERCGDISAQSCNARVVAARQNFVDAGLNGMATVPGADLQEWLDCGYDRTLFNPAHNHRPGGSVQYSMALGDFNDPNQTSRFRWGFVGSSDNHTARPGTGYKEVRRKGMTDGGGPRSERIARIIGPRPVARTPESVPADGSSVANFFARTEFERQMSYFMTGGLAAVHADGRDRGAIWDALARREVYGTSGPKILLWFDLLNAPDGRVPMGADVATTEEPWFRVRAAGALKQKPGCPTTSTSALTPERLARVCMNECDNPGEERHVITRIEVVRIRPQVRADEPIGALIEDPWLRLACDGRADGCVVDFRDPDYPTLDREVAYYARAIQEPTDAVNAGADRCNRDAEGRCVDTRPCFGDYRTSADDDCLSPNEERAWSSPIHLRPR